MAVHSSLHLRKFLKNSMTDSYDIEVDHCVIEFTPKKHDNESIERFQESSPFIFLRSECRIKISYGWKMSDVRLIKVYLRCAPPLSQNFYTEVSIFKGKNFISYPSKKVTDLFINGSSLLYIFSIPFQDVTERLHSTYKWDISFKFVFQTKLEENVRRNVSCHQNVKTENSCLEVFSKDLSAILESGKDYDVELINGEKTIKAHRIFLRARSKYFREELQKRATNSKTGEITRIHLPFSVHPGAFREIIRYIYSGQLPDLNFELAKNIYNADKLCEGLLKRTCENFLIENMTTGNACEMLTLAKEDSFKEKVSAYIISERIPFINEYWLPFCEQHSKLAVEILNKLVSSCSCRK